MALDTAAVNKAPIVRPSTMPSTICTTKPMMANLRALAFDVRALVHVRQPGQHDASDAQQEADHEPTELHATCQLRERRRTCSVDWLRRRLAVRRLCGVIGEMVGRERSGLLARLAHVGRRRLFGRRMIGSVLVVIHFVSHNDLLSREVVIAVYDRAACWPKTSPNRKTLRRVVTTRQVRRPSDPNRVGRGPCTERRAA